MPLNFNATKDQNRPKPAEQERKSRSGQIVKPFKKTTAQSLQIQELIAHLIKVFDHDWENNLGLDVESSTRANIFFINLDIDSSNPYQNTKHPLRILVFRLLKANA